MAQVKAAAGYVDASAFVKTATGYAAASVFVKTAAGYVSAGGAPAFDPASLFGVNDRGSIHDITDNALLFQASGGSGAVAVGSPIGYASDLGPIVRPALQATAGSRPLWSGMPRTLGAEMAVNGRFVTDSDWTKGAGWTINTGTGKAEKTAGTASVLSQAMTLTAGKHYQITFNITRTAGTVVARFTGGTNVLGASRSAAGSYLDVLIAATGNTTLEFSADAAFAGSVDNCSIKEVTTFTNMGAWFDGADDRLQTTTIDLSNSDKATVVFVGYYSQRTAIRIAFELGNYYSNVPGSIMGMFNGKPRFMARGSVAQVELNGPDAEGPENFVGRAHINMYEVDFSQATTQDELDLMGRGINLVGAPVGVEAGAGNMVNGALTIGAAANNAQFWSGLIHKVFVINRLLTTEETTNLISWARQGMAFCAVVGDSTVSFNSSAYSLSTAASVSSIVGGMVTGAADISLPGHRIANQLAAWSALADKSALQAVVVQIGLNDVKGRVGENAATTAQVITDYQSLINTINADKPAGCKVYVSQMTPCKTWLDGATNPASAYAAWQALNEAIAGNGATPITGVDRRITSHVAALAGAGDILNPIYDHNADGVHESNEGRFIIAQAWRTALEADGLV